MKKKLCDVLHRARSFSPIKMTFFCIHWPGLIERSEGFLIFKKKLKFSTKFVTHRFFDPTQSFSGGGGGMVPVCVLHSRVPNTILTHLSQGPHERFVILHAAGGVHEDHVKFVIARCKGNQHTKRVKGEPTRISKHAMHQ